MDERSWPEEDKETREQLPAEGGDDVDPAATPGGVDPVTGEQGPGESQNADIPAA
jgi:hypothetical protein